MLGPDVLPAPPSRILCCSLRPDDSPEASQSGSTWLEPGNWAIVTAWNPAGLRRPAEDNRRDERALLDLIRGRSFQAGVNGEGEWAEPSVMLWQTSLREAVSLGRRFGQAAVVFGVGRRAALVWLEPHGVGVERLWVSPVL